VIAVSDLYEDRVADAQQIAKKAGKKAPKGFADYHDLLSMKGLDAVISPSSWQNHYRICMDCMDAGIPVGVEVGGVTSLEECWDLVRKHEATHVPCMMLENCCYGRKEMTILHMIRLGLFGEVVHAEGGYCHDLRHEICTGIEERHYRWSNFIHRNGELYPTHELGPIARYLNINRGNRMVSLVSMASKSVWLHDWIARNRPAKHPSQKQVFNEGDIVTSMIKCANGETITLKHGCSLHRPYSRGNVVEGTRGIWMEDKNAISIEGLTAHNDSWDPETWEDLDKFYDKYEHPLWKTYAKKGLVGGHGGMDGLVLRAFLTAVKNNTPTPIDIYDMVSWLAITPLSEDSIVNGSAPVAIPDFTHGLWMNPRPVVHGPYSLDVDEKVEDIL